MNYAITIDDMTAMVFALGVARIDSHWELSVALMLGAVAIRFVKAYLNGTQVSGN